MKSISGVALSGNAPGSLKYPISTTLSLPFRKNVNDSKSYVLAVPMVMSFKVLKCFSSDKNKFLSISLLVVTRSQTKEIDVFFFQKS